MTSVASPSLRFDAETHTYHLGDRRLLGVTEILKSIGLIDTEFYTEEGRTRGQYVAMATQYHDEGTLRWETLHPELLPYVQAWQRFLTESKAKVLEIEKPVCSESYGYAGTLDRVIRLAPGTAPVVVDIKLGQAQPWHPLQLAAYARCLSPTYRRANVYLRPDGTFKFEIRSNPHDERVFLAAAAVAAWKVKNGVE